MYTIISGTNRIASRSEKVAAEYRRILNEKCIDACIFSLINLDILHRTPGFLKTETLLLGFRFVARHEAIHATLPSEEVA